MFRFRFGRIPVTVHVSHLIVSALIAYAITRTPPLGSVGWPNAILAQSSHPEHDQTLVLVMLLWMGMIFLSVLVHELGHASVARWFGYPPHVQLIGLGGLTFAEGGEAMPWHQDVLHTLAGPAAGLLLGVSSGLALLAWNAAGTAPPLASYTLDSLFRANLVWTALNLLPLATLDGGRIASAVLARLFGRPGYLVAQLLSLGLASAFFLFALSVGELLMMLLVVMLGVRTYANLVGWYRGELPRGEGAHPLLAEAQRAEQALQAGKLEEAEALSRALLQGEPPAVVQGRAHLVLGWVLLKRGQGQAALAELMRVPPRELPAHAVAAAYSLSGDEAKALPLWAQAAEQTGNDVVRHEFAGALVRSGREAEARRLPGIRLALAYRSAERVYYVRGEYERAAEMAEAAFREEPSAPSAYDAACAFSRAGKAEAALRMLALAAQNGFTDVEAARGDPDLASLRELPQFQTWLEGLGAPSPAVGLVGAGGGAERGSELD